MCFEAVDNFGAAVTCSIGCNPTTKLLVLTEPHFPSVEAIACPTHPGHLMLSWRSEAKARDAKVREARNDAVPMLKKENVHAFLGHSREPRYSSEPDDDSDVDVEQVQVDKVRAILGRRQQRRIALGMLGCSVFAAVVYYSWHPHRLHQVFNVAFDAISVTSSTAMVAPIHCGSVQDFLTRNGESGVSVAEDEVQRMRAVLVGHARASHADTTLLANYDATCESFENALPAIGLGGIIEAFKLKSDSHQLDQLPSQGHAATVMSAAPRRFDEGMASSVVARVTQLEHLVGTWAAACSAGSDDARRTVLAAAAQPDALRGFMDMGAVMHGAMWQMSA